MKEYLTAKEAAAITDLATNTITLAAQKGELKGFKQGGKWLLLSSSVMELKKNPHKKGTKRNRKQVDEQLTIYDFAEPAYTPKHAAEPIDWKDKPRFTYYDLLEQYNRGVEDGKKQCRS